MSVVVGFRQDLTVSKIDSRYQVYLTENNIDKYKDILNDDTPKVGQKIKVPDNGDLPGGS